MNQLLLSQQLDLSHENWRFLFEWKAKINNHCIENTQLLKSRHVIPSKMQITRKIHIMNLCTQVQTIPKYTRKLLKIRFVQFWIYIRNYHNSHIFTFYHLVTFNCYFTWVDSASIVLNCMNSLFERFLHSASF